MLRRAWALSGAAAPHGSGFEEVTGTYEIVRFFVSGALRTRRLLGMVVTDALLLDSTTRDDAIRELATLAAHAFAAQATREERAISTRVAVTRSSAGEWRIVVNEADYAEDDTPVEMQVFRGQGPKSLALVNNVKWAVGKVWEIAKALGRV